jgi:hypothetical protein
VATPFASVFACDHGRVRDPLAVGIDHGHVDVLWPRPGDLRFRLDVHLGDADALDAREHVEHDAQAGDAHDERDHQPDREPLDRPFVPPERREHAPPWPRVGT